MVIQCKPRKCEFCRAPLTPDAINQSICCMESAIKAGKEYQEKLDRKREKAERANDKLKREQLKTLREWKADLKKVMHLYVRLRDEGKPCISCDTILIRAGKPGGDYDAGHCRSVGSAKHLEFDDRNVHGQCKHCNNTQGLAGNYHEYRNRLPARIGKAAFDALMCDQEARHITISDCKERIAHYKTLIKELQR